MDLLVALAGVIAIFFAIFFGCRYAQEKKKRKVESPTPQPQPTPPRVLEPTPEEKLAVEREIQRIYLGKRAAAEDEFLRWYTDRKTEVVSAAEQFDREMGKKQEEQNKKFISLINLFEEEKAAIAAEKAAIQEELEGFRAKRIAINEAERLERVATEEFAAYHIVLSQEQKDDIDFILSLLPKINNKEVVYKIIWSDFIQPKFKDMLQKQFGVNIPSCVIYLIEDKNGKQYIGKTVSDVSKRWSEHLKSSLNIGTISHAKIHEALFRHWDEFSFSVLEVVTKNTINEREKFYIDSFKTNIYGYNIKSGG